MVTKTLSHQEALDRARSNRVYLMVLFGFAIVGILGDLRYLEGSSADFVWIFLGLMTIFFFVFARKNLFCFLRGFSLCNKARCNGTSLS